MGKKLEDLPWVYDDHGGRFGAIGCLPAWVDFSDESGDPRVQGELVEFRLSDEVEDSPLYISDGCKRAYNWLVENDQLVHKQVIIALDNFFPTLREQWKEFGDTEMENIESTADIYDKFNLAYVKLFPHEKLGTPYFGFDFDCAWNSEGFRVLLNGTRVVEIQADELSEYAVEQDGGVA